MFYIGFPDLIEISYHIQVLNNGLFIFHVNTFHFLLYFVSLLEVLMVLFYCVLNLQFYGCDWRIVVVIFHPFLNLL